MSLETRKVGSNFVASCRLPSVTSMISGCGLLMQATGVPQESQKNPVLADRNYKGSFQNLGHVGCWLKRGHRGSRERAGIRQRNARVRVSGCAVRGWIS